MICIFGLFHGLILLPVVLCLLGPIENEDEKVSLARIHKQIILSFKQNLEIEKVQQSQEARKNAVALANAKESLDHQFQLPVDQPGHNHFQQPINQANNNHYQQTTDQPSNNHYQQTTDQQLKVAEQQLKSSDEVKSEVTVKDVDNKMPARDHPGGDPENLLKPADGVDQCAADGLKPIENQPTPVNNQLSLDMEMKVPDKAKLREERNLKGESRISIETGDDEEAMEALLSHNMRETEIR